MFLAGFVHKKNFGMSSKLDRRVDRDICEDDDDDDDCDEDFKFSFTRFTISTLSPVSRTETFPSVTIPTALPSSISISVSLKDTPPKIRTLTEAADSLARTNLRTYLISYIIK
jgi:hypothetical protein